MSSIVIIAEWHLNIGLKTCSTKESVVKKGGLTMQLTSASNNYVV